MCLHTVELGVRVELGRVGSQDHGPGLVGDRDHFIMNSFEIEVRHCVGSVEVKNVNPTSGQLLMMTMSRWEGSDLGGAHFFLAGQQQQQQLPWGGAEKAECAGAGTSSVRRFGSPERV